jgi:hypothetical protein
VETLVPIKASFAEISASFPQGMEVVAIDPLKGKLSSNVPKSVNYTLLDDALPPLPERPLAQVQNHRGVPVDLNEHILSLEATPGAWHIKAKCNNQGVSVSPYTLFAGLLGITDNEARSRKMIKTGVE